MEKCNIYNCNIYLAQKYIKHKWFPIILYLIGKNDKVTFSFLLNNIEYISNKRLSEGIKILNKEDIIFFENEGYRLTKRGKELYNIIMMMSNFN